MLNTLDYPKSPKDLPKGLTSLSANYAFKSVLGILAVILFFGLYFSLIYGTLVLADFAWSYEVEHYNKWRFLLKVASITGSMMLFAFTLKFLFKLKKPSSTNRIELNEVEQPKLWAFVRNICSETNAPLPKYIYADPEVNAYVCYSSTWLSLFLPVKKELTIGLGLIETVKQSEFKAILSHEFGHFSQKSMKIGSYIHSANSIIYDMIYTEDAWDKALESWKELNLYLSIPAWILTPIIGLIRYILKGFYHLLNRVNASLSQEMEFNADKVAVSTSGSEAIVSGLWKLGKGYDHWNSVIQNTHLALQKKIYIKNFYSHMHNAVAENDEILQNEFQGLATNPRGGKHFFETNSLAKTPMYASHPSNDKREHSAKTPFVECETNQNSVWELINYPHRLQERMTKVLYLEYLNFNPPHFNKPEEFTEFITNENQSRELLNEYQNTFENRFIEIPSSQEIKNQLQSKSSEDNYKRLMDDLWELMIPINKTDKLLELISLIDSGETQIKTVQFEGNSYGKKDLGEAWYLINNNRNSLFNESFKEWDSRLCFFHCHLAQKSGQLEHLQSLFTQHKTFVSLFRTINSSRAILEQELSVIQESEEIEQFQIATFLKSITEALTKMNEDLNSLNKLQFVPLPNIETLEVLKESITDGGRFANPFSLDNFMEVFDMLDYSSQKMQRLDLKGVILILETFEKLRVQKT
ncbi:M48 family metallopeptidase [Fibrobacterales bacterium]|nr:M48 family metallopeptidase [Fibrobacterales bacterium]